MKKNILIIIFLCILSVICAVSIQFAKNYNGIKNDINISMSRVIVPTDVETADFAHTEDYQTKYSEEYDFYTCIFYVENNSDYYINMLSFYGTETYDDFIIDYRPNVPFDNTVPPNSSMYLPIIVPVKKGIDKEKLQNLADTLPDKANVLYSGQSDYLDTSELSGFVTDINKVDEDYSSEPYIYDLAR